MSNPFITLNDVSIRLHDRILFDGLSWEMFGDQHWVVIGPNGSGKSTLMKALCGSIPIVQGKITYHFAQNDGHAAPQDRIAYVTFESQRAVLGDEAFYQERWNIGVNEDTLSVTDFLSESSIKQVNAFHVVESEADKEYDARRERVVEQLELQPLLNRSVVQLSNGERRKVTIARALLKQPKLLILDNPFAGLDERFRSKLAQNIHNLMQSEMRVIMVGTNRDEIPPSVTNILDLSFRAKREISLSWNEISRHNPSTSLRSAHAKRAPRNDMAGKLANLKLETQVSSRNVLVEMKNVNVAYNGTAILRQVNWTIRENERWALLGANGAGKTTLLSLILADNPQAYANDITLFGKRRGSGESIWEIKQHIGWVAPELQLYYPRNATCFDVVCSGWFDSVGLYRQCSPQQREIAESWLAKFGLGKHSATIFDQVAEGEQRLTLLARALVKNPILLVLDEPCQGLDTTNRDLILQAIDTSVSRENTSLIYVTHRADEMPQSITHVLRLSEGHVV
ncbi:MAG: ATP-binding cassette domain-containing protein [Chloroflexi bacterium]|nr:ATP-binding cassette domain-containing protein [Chloroflexota bacterium]